MDFRDHISLSSDMRQVIISLRFNLRFKQIFSLLFAKKGLKLSLYTLFEISLFHSIILKFTEFSLILQSNLQMYISDQSM